MDSQNSLQIIKTSIFDGVEFSLYQKPEDSEFWGTREQIGAVLGYCDPAKAIGNIHSRNKERLDKFSTLLKLRGVEGDREVEREVTIYSFKGLLEICRFSNQPKADAVMDFVWQMADSVRKHGAYMTPEKIEEVLTNPDTIIRLAQNLKAEQEKRRALEAEAKENAPLILFAKSVQTSEQSILIGNLAKLLCQNDIEIGQRRLFEWLRERGYLMKQKGENWNMPTQRSLEMELFEVKRRVINCADDNTRVVYTTKVTPKGQIYFVNLFLKNKEAA